MTRQKTFTALVTGGTGGIGLHSAIGIAKAGAKVLVTGRDAERGQAARAAIAEASDNPDINFVQGDISSIRGIDQLVADVSAHTNTLDVLVNNAGYFGDTARQSNDQIEMHFAVNVLAPWRLTRALLPLLRTAPSARVLM